MPWLMRRPAPCAAIFQIRLEDNGYVPNLGAAVNRPSHLWDGNGSRPVHGNNNAILRRVLLQTDPIDRIPERAYSRLAIGFDRIEVPMIRGDHGFD